MFPTLTTDRLHLRPVSPGDLDALVARRNDPAVARHQDWTFPYGIDEARALIEAAAAEVEPGLDSWFMLSVTGRTSDAVVGDIVFRLTEAHRTAEVGYTFAREHWGRGLATEAVTELIRHLFDERGVGRIRAQLHPENVASAMLLERTGFVFEGVSRETHWTGGEISDDWIYGLTRSDWEAWWNRPRFPPEEVRLIEITPDNQRAIAALRTHHSQTRFVSSVEKSFGDALFPEVHDGAPVVPWYRAVEADGELAGFVMLTQITEHHPVPYLWRLLIDRRHQRRGMGTSVLDAVVAVCRGWGATALEVSWCEGRGSPRPFYERYGFTPTGRIVDGETEGRLTIA